MLWVNPELFPKQFLQMDTIMVAIGAISCVSDIFTV